MANLYVKETFINKTGDYQYGESDIYETFTDNKGQLFRSLVKEYGRCTGKVHLERNDGQTLTIGWVFEKRAKYSDSKETYIQQTWITVFKRAPIKKVKYFYAEI